MRYTLVPMLALAVIFQSESAQTKKPPVKIDWSKVPKLGDKDAEKKNVALRKLYGGKDVLIEGGVLRLVLKHDDGSITANFNGERALGNAKPAALFPVTIHVVFKDGDFKALKKLSSEFAKVNIVGVLSHEGRGENGPLLIEEAAVVGKKKKNP